MVAFDNVSHIDLRGAPCGAVVSYDVVTLQQTAADY